MASERDNYQCFNLSNLFWFIIQIFQCLIQLHFMMLQMEFMIYVERLVPHTMAYFCTTHNESLQ